MSLNFGTKVLAGAIAMAIGGAAMAQTTLDATTTGDVFLNIVNTSNDTSFLYDTGISTASFTSSTSFSVNLASDPNYQAFIAASGTLDYSVISSTSDGTVGTNKSNEFTVDTTGVIAPLPVDLLRSNLGQANTSISAFLVNADSTASATKNSVLLSGATAFWGAASNEGEVSENLFNGLLTPYDDSTAPGAPLTFYQESVTGGINALGTWDLNGAVATFAGANVGTGPSPVPLPTPLLLLLSGLGLMGVVARRGKPSVDVASGAAAV